MFDFKALNSGFSLKDIEEKLASITDSKERAAKLKKIIELYLSIGVDYKLLMPSLLELVTLDLKITEQDLHELLNDESIPDRSFTFTSGGFSIVSSHEEQIYYPVSPQIIREIINIAIRNSDLDTVHQLISLQTLSLDDKIQITKRILSYLKL
jgi:hypothetical protein